MGLYEKIKLPMTSLKEMTSLYFKREIGSDVTGDDVIKPQPKIIN